MLKHRALCLGALGLLALVPSVCLAEDHVAKFGSNWGTGIFLVAGVGLPLLRDGDEAKVHCLRALDALAVSGGIAEGLKQVHTVQGWVGSQENDGFPSAHTAAVFSVATIEASFHPKEAPLWYLGAASIGWSRVNVRAHTPAQVVAGAALGYAVGRIELSSKKGLLISPFLTDQGKLGLSLSGKF